MLIGLGFKPLQAAGIALIATPLRCIRALGTPITALATVTNIPAETLGAMVGRQLPIFSLIIPFWLIWAMCGWRKMLEVWPACLTAGLSFAVVQFGRQQLSRAPAGGYRRLTGIDCITDGLAPVLAAT